MGDKFLRIENKEGRMISDLGLIVKGGVPHFPRGTLLKSSPDNTLFSVPTANVLYGP